MHNLQVATYCISNSMIPIMLKMVLPASPHAFPVFLRQGGEGSACLALGFPALDDQLDEAQPDLLRRGLLLEQPLDEPRSFLGERREHSLNLSQVCHAMIDWRGACNGLTGLGRRTA